MPTHKAVVTAPVGLHARPAAVFVRAVTDTGLPVTIAKAGSHGVDARSLLQVMTADFHHGCEVLLDINESALSGAVSREKAEDVLQGLVSLLESQGVVQTR